MSKIILLLALLLGGCSEQRAEQFTLYRNSSVDPTLRIHFATFNANESDGSYNMTNCQMDARLLNANIAALAKAEGRGGPVGLGFWCEPGAFKSKGQVPMEFDAKYPTAA